MKREILAPAGDEQSAYAALDAGADAVYLGLKQFSARQNAENFDIAAFMRVTDYAHILGAKVYVCLNTLVKDDETALFFESARLAWNAGADAILVQDIFLGKTLKELYPEIVLHLSTQAGCCNVYGAQLAAEYGFSRVVLARETPLKEIAAISQIIETEAFVQGALCTCFSGQCYLSSFAGNNSGNRGRCKQPCRKRYQIDRAGFEEFAYALSPSDLSVGKRLQEYLAAGVFSLKIEGRMRRPEYVAAAVEYYRALLNGSGAGDELSRLKRAYNRGDYTCGLAFGQTGNFLSRKVQGHIGEDVGEITLRGGKYFCASAFLPRKGDGFKILRKGKEVGGAAFLSADRGGFYLGSAEKLSAGDRVRVTTDTAAAGRTLQEKRRRKISVSLRFVAGEPIYAEGAGVVLTGEILPAAKTAPLTEAELLSCFQKTDCPLEAEITAETAGAFLPKSQLNAFRREFYAKIKETLAPVRTPLALRTPPVAELTPQAGKLTAVLGGDLKEKADIKIYKPQDYRSICPPKGANYLYLPPFFTGDDEETVLPALSLFEGIYCDGYYGILFAEKYQKKLFAGTGFNLVNRYAVNAVQSRAAYFALSKELSAAEQRALSSEGAFALAYGAVKVMDLCYCPFERDCANCDKRECYTLTDESGRAFPLRRYRFRETPCRFELFNCAQLSAYNGFTSVLKDDTLKTEGACPHFSKKTAGMGVTKGHMERSMQ